MTNGGHKAYLHCFKVVPENHSSQVKIWQYPGKEKTMLLTACQATCNRGMLSLRCRECSGHLMTVQTQPECLSPANHLIAEWMGAQKTMRAVLTERSNAPCWVLYPVAQCKQRLGQSPAHTSAPRQVLASTQLFVPIMNPEHVTAIITCDYVALKHGHNSPPGEMSHLNTQEQSRYTFSKPKRYVGNDSLPVIRRTGHAEFCAYTELQWDYSRITSPHIGTLYIWLLNTMCIVYKPTAPPPPTNSMPKRKKENLTLVDE